MGVTNEFERDVNDTSFLRRPGRVDLRILQNTADAGDGHPGLQRAFRNYLHEGGMEKDLENASVSGARLIGINNRNLSSFETDLSIAVRLVSMLSPGQIPIAASGIKDRIDIEKNLETGINNFLIGESLVRAKKASDFIKSLST